MHKEPYPHDKVMAVIFLPLVPRSVTPNMVTILRFILTPFVAYFLIQHQYRIAIPLFIFTAFTDILDGSLARIRKQVTAWGTIADPIADKLLISSCVVILVVRYLSPWIAIILIGLEVIFVLGGLFKKRRGIIRSPSWWGKMKMLSQVIAVTVMLFGVAFHRPEVVYFANYIFVVAILLATINIISYGLEL